VALQPEFIVARRILFDPLDQAIEHLLLVFRRRELFRLPPALVAMGNADVNAGVQEPQFGAVRQSGLDQVAVAALNDPLAVGI
jgi:hypothetical protein